MARERSKITPDPLAATTLFGRDLPRLLRALTEDRLYFDRTRRARRIKEAPRNAQPKRGFPPAHAHSFFEICILLSGNCPFLLGDDRIDLRTGDVVILSPDVFHREMAADDCDPYQLLWLAFEIDRTWGHLQVHLGKGRFEQGAYGIELPRMPHGLALAKAVDLELWEAAPGAFTRAQGLLLQLCGLLEKSAAEIGASSKKSDERTLQNFRVQQAMTYVRDHFAQPLDLPEVAHHVGVSSGYLSAMFTRALGRSFTDFLAACRVEEAQRLLQKPEFSIKEIAQRVGLDNPFYFSRLFRKHAGRSPKEFRKSLAK